MHLQSNQNKPMHFVVLFWLHGVPSFPRGHTFRSSCIFLDSKKSHFFKFTRCMEKCCNIGITESPLNMQRTQCVVHWSFRIFNRERHERSESIWFSFVLVHCRRFPTSWFINEFWLLTTVPVAAKLLLSSVFTVIYHLNSGTLLFRIFGALFK